MSQVVSSATLKIFETVCFIYVRPVILTSGVAASAISARVFYKMGLSDSVSISFFLLCLFDLGYLTISSVSGICIILNLTVSYKSVTWGFEPINVNSFSYWCANVFYYSSLLATAYIAVVRCCCVTIPFRFRSVFTRGRTVAAFVCIFVLSLVFHVPVLINQYLAEVRTPPSNTTRIVVLMTVNWPVAIAFYDIFNRNILSWITMAVIFVSFVLLSVSLKQSSNFRLHAAVGRNNGRDKTTDTSRPGFEPTLIQPDVSTLHHNRIFKPGQSPSHKSGPNKNDQNRKPYARESVKDLQIIKSVASLSALFLVLALPFMVYSLFRRLVPEFDDGQVYGNLFRIVTSMSAVCAYLNSSLNAFIFYSVNTKFRLTFQRMLGGTCTCCKN